MRETYSTIRHLLHLATELDRACALFLSTHVSITHDEARVLLELGAAQHLLRPGALAKQLNLQPIAEPYLLGSAHGKRDRADA